MRKQAYLAAFDALAGRNGPERLKQKLRMAAADPNLALANTLDTSVKFRKRICPAKHTRRATPKSRDDRFPHTRLEQNQDMDRRVTAIERPRDLKPVSAPGIYVRANQYQMGLAGHDNRQNLSGSGNSNNLKARVASQRLREKLVAHAIPVSNQYAGR